MTHTERLYVAIPEEFPTANKVIRVDPNDGFPVDATIDVFAEDGQRLTFTSVRKGPQQSEYLLSLKSSNPQITTNPPIEKEIYVRDDRIIRGEEFTLDSMFPVVIGRTVFKAMAIFANVDSLVVPLDGRPINGGEDIKEII